MSSTFPTLLLREWLQHRRAWLLLSALPPLLLGGLLAFGSVQVDLDVQTNGVRPLQDLPPVGVAMATVLATSGLCLLLAWVSALILSPSLARRDQSDRSIEFWCSMPVGHAPALASPLVAHLLLFPLGALLIGLVCGLLLTVLSIGRVFGLDAWTALPWGSVVAGAFALGGRLALGLVLATLWLAPVIMVFEAASAWLRRWGVPVVVGSWLLVGTVLENGYGFKGLSQITHQLMSNVGRSFIATSGSLKVGRGSDLVAEVQNLPAWAAHDAGQAILLLAQPLFGTALLVAAAGFALLILRRRQGG